MSGWGFGGMGGGGGGGGGSSTAIKCVTKTADYNVLAADSGTLFDNLGAVAQVIFTLPASQARPANGNVWLFGFEVLAAQNLRILAQGADVIDFGNQPSAAGGYIENADVGSIIWLVNPSSGIWTCYGYGMVPWTVN